MSELPTEHTHCRICGCVIDITNKTRICENCKKRGNV
jgi:hypothetical protein